MGLNQAVKMVQAFHELNGWPIRTTTEDRGVINVFWRIESILQQASRLAQETAEERNTLYPNDVRMWMIHMLCEELTELVSGISNNDEKAIADGGGDLEYVLKGIFMRYDLPAQEIFEEIHRSNMTKRYVYVEGENHKRSRNKGPNYSPPDLQKAIREGRERLAFLERIQQEQNSELGIAGRMSDVSDVG